MTAHFAARVLFALLVWAAFVAVAYAVALA